MERGTISKKRNTLTAWESKKLAEGLELSSHQGCAIASIAKLLHLSLCLNETEPCPQCKEDHEVLTSGAVQGGLCLALEALGMDAARRSENMEEIVKQDRSPHNNPRVAAATRALEQLFAARNSQGLGSESAEEVKTALSAGVQMAELVLNDAVGVFSDTPQKRPTR